MMNKKQADALVRRATDGEIKDFATLKELKTQAIPAQDNPILENIDQKLVEMMVIDTFNTAFKEKFEQSFDSKKEITIGAFLQVVGIGLGKSKPDTLTANTDLLPDITSDAKYRNLVKTYLINWKRKYEVLITDEVYKQAFTSINSFGTYIGLLRSEMIKTWSKELFETMLRLIHKQVINQTDLGIFTYTNEDEKAQKLRTIFETIFNDISQHVPYSDKFNLGIDYSVASPKFGQNTAADDTRNDSGLDYPNILPKYNTLEMTRENGLQKFNDLNLILTASLDTQYSTKVLGDIFHDSYNSLDNKFKSIILSPKTVANVEDGTTVDYETQIDANTIKYSLVVIDKMGFVIGTNINAFTNQQWAGGVGGYLQQNQLHSWNTLAAIPFANGKRYFFTLKKTTTQNK